MCVHAHEDRCLTNNEEETVVLSEKTSELTNVEAHDLNCHLAS